MAEIRTIARPYAEALFESVKDSNTSAWLESLQNFSEAVQLPEVQRVIAEPKIEKDKLLALLLSLARVSQEQVGQMEHFLQLLLDNHRLDVLPEIKTLFEDLVNQSSGCAEVHITSAFELDDSQLNDLLDRLETKFQRKLKPFLTIDSTLIGGICVMVGDEVLDLSVRAQLAHMQNALTS